MKSSSTKVTRRSALALFSAPLILAAASRPDAKSRWLDEFGRNTGRGDLDADMEAFARASEWLQANRGGTLNLRQGVTYSAGRQRLNGTKDGGYSWIPDPIIRCDGATRPVVVNGNGATIRASLGLRYGSFDPVTGVRLDTKAPYFRSYTERAVPYEGMVELTNCRAGFTISNLELDGSNGSALLGGEFGDQGRQIPGSGLHLIDNTGPVHIENVYSHHHCWDGMLFRHLTEGEAAARAVEDVRIVNFRATFNGRQGMSLTGGRNITLLRCHFATTGKGALRSAPAAGLDIEPEGGQVVRNVRCRDCMFEDNDGAGLLADIGDAEGMAFERCTFLGTTSFSAWPNRPGMKFMDCNFVGSVIAVFAAKNGTADAAMFIRCLFTDDRSRSPSRTVFGSDGKGSAFVVDLGDDSRGAIFTDCVIRAVHDARMVYAKGQSTQFVGCKLSERTSLGSWPSGIYHQKSSIISRGAHFDDVRLADAAVLYVNGRKVQSDASGKIVRV